MERYEVQLVSKLGTDYISQINAQIILEFRIHSPLKIFVKIKYFLSTVVTFKSYFLTLGHKKLMKQSQ